MATFGMLAPAPTTTIDPTDDSIPYQAISSGSLSLLQQYAAAAPTAVTRFRDGHGYTLWHAAASYGRVDILEWLWEQHAKEQQGSMADIHPIHVTDEDGDGVLHYAGTVDAVRWLTGKGGANLTHTNEEGKTAFEARKEELEEAKRNEDDYDEEDEETQHLIAVVAHLESLSSLPQ